MKPNIAGRKERARDAARRKRKQAFNPRRQKAAMANLAKAAETWPSGVPVAGYLAIGTELDPRGFMVELCQRGSHEICVPVVAAKGAALRFRKWAPDAALETGPFGVSVPAHGSWLVPGILMVPMLAFDRNGYRLGYGGGYYDRTLRELRASQSVWAVGLAFAAQETDLLPCDSFDQAVDAVVTEKEIMIVNPAIDPAAAGAPCGS